jgi:hypothetical protein
VTDRAGELFGALARAAPFVDGAISKLSAFIDELFTQLPPGLGCQKQRTHNPHCRADEKTDHEISATIVCCHFYLLYSKNPL